MSKNYDNWERLVVAVLRRQQDREIALCPSTNSSAFSSRSSSFSREFYDQLHDAIIKNQNFPFALSNYTSYLEDERNGKKSYMVGAKDLIITFGNNSVKWQWRFDDNYSREVAEMCSSGRFDVRAKIAAGMLNPRTVYGAYLVYKLRETAEGLETAKGSIRFVDDEGVGARARARARVVQLHPGEGEGWMEVDVGSFYVGERDEGEVETRLVGTLRRWKCGLIVQGVAFRPSFTFTDAPLLSNKFKSTSVWA